MPGPVLAPTDQVLHNILHAAVQDRGHAVGALPFKQLVILTRLVRVHGAEVDWQEIRARMEAQGLGRELRGPLAGLAAHRPATARGHDRRGSRQAS